jgi:WD40 repeat protein
VVSVHPCRRTVAVAVSPDGHWFAVCGYELYTEGYRTPTGHLAVWDTSTGAHVRTLHGHTDDVISGAWSPDGSLLATASNDDIARVWRPVL